MPKFKNLQTSFNSGEFSPLISSRLDLTQYYKGAKSLKNCQVLPQGGVTKRPGFELLTKLDVPNAESDFVRLIPFVFNDLEKYTLALKADGKITVYNAKSVAAEVQTKFVGTMIKEVQFTSSGDTVIMVHPRVHPQELKRDRTKTPIEWTVKDMPLKNIPLYSFDSGADPDKLYDIQEMKFYFFKGSETFALNIGGVVKPSITYNLSYKKPIPNGGWFGDDASNLVSQIQTSFGSAYEVTPLYKTTSERVVVSTYTETIGSRDREVTRSVYETQTKRVFNSIKIQAKTEKTGKSFTVAYQSTSAVSIDIVPTGGQKPEVQPEAVWSETRGYPATVAFHQGRLVFGGSLARPQTIWLSRAGSVYDFGVTDPDNLVANDSMDITLASTQASAITGLDSSRDLIVLTIGGVFKVFSAEGILQPTTISAKQESRIGSKFTYPVNFDNRTFYLQNTGAELNSISYDFTTDAYQTFTNALFSSHLLKNPFRISTLNSGDKFNTNYLIVTNSDGTLAVFSSLLEQEIKNWSPYVTDGQIIDSVGLGSDLIMAIRRYDADGVAHLTLERMTQDNHYCDSYEEFHADAPQTAFGGFSRFKGKEVAVLADNYPLKITVEDDVVELPFKASHVVVGLPLHMAIETLPLNVQLGSGQAVWNIKRITKATLNLVDSLDVSLQYNKRKYTVANRNFNTDLLNPPTPITGIKEVRLVGFTKEATVIIESREPTPLTLLSIQLEVHASG